MNKLWLDLEIRKDIDDYLTLVFALENNHPISVVSINNPSTSELSLLHYTLNKFHYNIPVVVTGEITEYDLTNDIHESLYSLILNYENNSYISINDIDNVENENYTFFCGGSLKTLSLLIDINKNIDAFIQGGFASFKLVGLENTLKKFKKREKVPSWNLNLDIEATDHVLKSNIKMTFISKNICHNSYISVGDLNTEDTFFNEIVKSFFKKNKYDDKCLHDLMAFFTIFYDFVKFKNVDLLRTDDDISKWWSIENTASNIRISTSCDFTSFKKLIKRI